MNYEGKKYFHGSFSSKIATYSTRNTNTYKIRRLRRTMFSVFYNISKKLFELKHCHGQTIHWKPNKIMVEINIVCGVQHIFCRDDF